MDSPYQQLIEIARHLERFESPAEVTKVMDEVEFIHELLEPEEQDLAIQLMERLTARLRSLGTTRRNSDAEAGLL